MYPTLAGLWEQRQSRQSETQHREAAVSLTAYIYESEQARCHTTIWKDACLPGVSTVCSGCQACMVVHVQDGDDMQLVTSDCTAQRPGQGHTYGQGDCCESPSIGLLSFTQLAAAAVRSQPTSPNPTQPNPTLSWPNPAPACCLHVTVPHCPSGICVCASSQLSA
jgi:hypothetical protein